MKKKYAAALGITLAISAAAVGIASQNQTTGFFSNAETEAKNTEIPSSQKAQLPKGRFEIVHGEVASVDGDTITINVATRTDDGDIQLSGETKEITISDDTIIREDMRGKFGQRGQKPDGQPPEKRDDTEASEQADDSQRLEKPANGQRPAFGADNGRGGAGPDGQPPEKPDDADDESADSGVPNGEPPMRPGNDAKMGGMDRQSTLTIEDISEGDAIAVFYDEDGNLKFIEVCAADEKAAEQKAV